MATDLTGLKVKDTYNSLLKIGDNSSLSATPDKISDGLGNESTLYLSTSQVSIGTLPATGYDLTVNSATKTGSIDIVGAATAATLRLTGGSGSQGTLSWNTDEETVDIIQNGATLQVGQEVQVHVKNQTGSTITDGTPVYVTGTLGASGRLTVAPMIADGTIEAKYFLGITTEDIPNGEDGKVTTFGKIRGLNTSAYSDGQTLYVSASTAGAFQTTAPVAPNLDLEIAIVIKSHANNGTIFVRANQGLYLGMLHDVYLNSPANNQFLVYNSTTSRWENQGIASVGSINLDTVTDNGNTTTNDINVGDITAGNMTLSGYLRGAANFVIDPAAYGDETGVVQILGDLRVDGITTTINSTTVTIDDKNIVLASGSATAADANGAGITIDGAAATMLYNSTSDRFVFNKDIQTNLVGNVTGNVTGNLTGDVTGNLTGDVTGNVTGDLTGNADTASALATARNIEIDGAVTGNADFNGSGDITITTTVNHNHDADYVNVTGDTMTGDLSFNDSIKANFGTNNDFRIQHNDTHAFLDNYKGAIFIRNTADDSDIILSSDDGSGSITQYLRVDGSEGSVILYHYGDQKLETTSTGVSVTGALSGNISTSSISGGTIDINGTTAINLQYNGSTQLRIDSTGVDYLGTVTFSNDGISLTDEDSTIDSFFHANIDYSGNQYTVTSNARYGADYIQVDGLDSREDRRFVISPKDIGSPDEDATLYLGGDYSITAPNTLMDWHTIEMKALSVQINNAEVATRTWVTSNITLQDVTDNGNTTTNSISIGKSTAPASTLDVDGQITSKDIVVDFNTGTLSHGVIFRGVASSAGEVGIRANGEAFEIYEPEQENKVWLSIADDPQGNGIAAQLNSPSGFTPILTNYNKGDYITKSYIDGLNVDADTFDGLNSTEFLRSNTADTFTGGTLTISSTAPILDFVDTNSFTDANDRFRIRAAGNVGQIRWYDDSAATDTVLTTFYPNGNVSIAGELSLGGAVINMANDDGFVYDDANNVMKVKYDGNQYDILTAANHTSFTDPKYLRSDQDDTTTGTLTIQKGLLDATFLNLLNQNTGGDISQQRSFIDFTYVDSNTNETPQVRIGAEVGQNGDADSTIKEGSGAFVVYTNNADTDAGIAGASLAERFRVDYLGRVGINNNTPFAKLQITGASQANGHYDDAATVLAEDNECRFQLLSTNDGNDASTILLTNVQSSTDNRHWVIGHRGPLRSNRFEIGYVASTASGNIGTGGYADFVIDTSGRVGVGIDAPSEQFEVNGDVRIYGSGSTIGGATVGNASLLIGSPTVGIGIDDNEIHSTGAMYIGTNTGNLVLRPADAVLINTTTTTGSAKLLVNGFLSTGSSAIAQFKGFIRAEGQLFLHHDSNNSNAARILYDGTNGLSFTTEGGGSSDFGIGTTSPSQRLSVEGGSIKLNNNNAAANYYLWLNKKEGQDGGILLQRDNSLDWQIVNVGNPNSGDLWFYSYGTSSAALTIERSSAQVGIVNTSPAVQLHVGTAALGASGGTPSIIGSNGISCGSGSRIAVDTGYYTHGYMQFNSSWGTESRYGLYGYYGISLNTRSGDSALVVRGDSNNVGIRCADPQTALEIRGNAPYLTISNLTENDGGIYFNDYQAGANPATSSQAASIKWSSSDNKMRICNNDANNLAIGIDMEGDVGIGTDSPTGKFNSYISAARQLTHNGNGGDLSIISDNNSAPVMYVKGTGTADLLNVYANTVEVFNIAASGNLSVYSATNGVGAKINFSDNRPTVTQFGTMEYTHLNTQSYGQGEAFKFYGSETSMAFHVAGIGLFTGDIIAYYSDMRLKTKLGDIENPIQKIQALSGFYYEPNEVAQSYGYEKERRLGLSAQEVKEVLPEAVSDAAIGDGYMAVDYAKLVPVLVEAIKEQQKQIDELKARLDGSTN